MCLTDLRILRTLHYLERSWNSIHILFFLFLKMCFHCLTVTSCIDYWIDPLYFPLHFNRLWEEFLIGFRIRGDFICHEFINFLIFIVKSAHFGKRFVIVLTVDTSECQAYISFHILFLTAKKATYFYYFNFYNSRPGYVTITTFYRMPCIQFLFQFHQVHVNFCRRHVPNKKHKNPCSLYSCPKLNRFFLFNCVYHGYRDIKKFHCISNFFCWMQKIGCL